MYNVIKDFVTRFFEVLLRLLQRLVVELSEESRTRPWLAPLWGQKIFELGIVKKILKTLATLNIGMSLYTFTTEGNVICISSLTDHERKTMRRFTPTKGEIVVDVGAYVGRYTLKAAGSVGNSGIVIAIEPEPNSYSILLRNLKLNEITNVHPINIALSNYDGACKLYFQDRPGTESIMRKSCKATIVTCRTLDSLLEELKVDHVDWVKVDVEGAEFRVLQGMTKTLQRNKRIKCLFEIHGGIPQGGNVEYDLKKLGFTILHMDPRRILASRNQK